MSIIITNKTDQRKVKYGYCSKCFGYNEVWRKEKTSTCAYCQTKMYHISEWKLWSIFFIIVYGIVIFFI